MELNKRDLKEGDLVLCKVEQVLNTVVFVRLPDGRKGTIISSEIAPGRIKYMQKYVVPNKEIVCKVLSVSGDKIHLSLRRVGSRERSEILKAHKQERAFNVALNQILGGEAESVRERILKDFGSLNDFFNKARKEKELIDKYFPEGKRQSIYKLVEKQKKKLSMRYIVEISCLLPDGLSRIKRVLGFERPEISLTYVAAGKFLLKFEVEDFKQGKKDLSQILEEIEKRAKENECVVGFKEER